MIQRLSSMFCGHGFDLQQEKKKGKKEGEKEGRKERMKEGKKEIKKKRKIWSHWVKIV